MPTKITTITVNELGLASAAAASAAQAQAAAAAAEASELAAASSETNAAASESNAAAAGEIAVDNALAANETVTGGWTFSGTTTLGSVASLGPVTTADIDGGTIDGAVIGGTTPAAGSFTTIDTSGVVTIEGDHARINLKDTAASANKGWTRLEVNSDQFAIAGFNDAGSFVGFDYTITKDTNGRADSHSWNVGGSELMKVEAGLLTVSTGQAAFAATVRPTLDGVYASGTSGQRWSVVYAVSGTINTSDEREKHDIQPLTEAEIAVGKRLKSQIVTFRWNDNPDQKQIGVIAQEVIAAFEAEGLDYRAYGVIQGGQDDPDSDKGYIPYGVNYDALLALVIGAL